MSSEATTSQNEHAKLPASQCHSYTAYEFHGNLVPYYIDGYGNPICHDHFDPYKCLDKEMNK